MSLLKSITKPLGLLLILAALVAAGTWYWRYNQNHPSTDDAYIQAHVISITPQASGEVVKTFVQNHGLVKKGQLLFEIDPKPYRIALHKAEANLASTQLELAALDQAIAAAKENIVARQAALTQAKQQAHRVVALANKDVVPGSDKDAAINKLHGEQAALKAAKKQLAKVQAKRGTLGPSNPHLKLARTLLAQAKLNLQYTQVHAPSSGYINNYSLRQGQMVAAYHPLFALIENQQWWVNANFKETQLTHIRAGDHANITLDMYPGTTFHGTVQSISQSSGSSFSLLPAENATGNWVKVTQRFTVKIALDPAPRQTPYRLGASANVTVLSQK